MGRVSISAQWLIIAAGVSLSPVLAALIVLLFARTLGRLLRRKLWRRSEVAPHSARDRGAVAAPRG
jgi:hypothetical protein